MGWLVAHNVVVIVDEAHIIFNTKDDDVFDFVYTNFLKHSAGLTALFFGTTSERVTSTGGICHSPPEMSKKFFWSGKFEVSDDLATELQDSGALLSAAAVAALAHISGLHRGIFARLGDWVEETQRAVRFCSTLSVLDCACVFFSVVHIIVAVSRLRGSMPVPMVAKEGEEAVERARTELHGCVGLLWRAEAGMCCQFLSCFPVALQVPCVFAHTFPGSRVPGWSRKLSPVAPSWRWRR
jgi:hypothetical protein